MAGAKNFDPPLYFKFNKYGYVFGTVDLQDGDSFSFFIEAGKASMVMIYGIRSFIGTRN